MINVRLEVDRWELRAPFSTSRDTVTHIETLTVILRDGQLVGRGEALGVDYLGESVASMRVQLETAMAGTGMDSQDPASLLLQLAPGGARNALDCALWDLRCKQAGIRAWELLGTRCEPVTTVYTLSLDTPEQMAVEALRHAQMPVLKLKLGGADPATRLRAVRAARPDAQLVIDANGGWTREQLLQMGPVLQACGVSMLEQPLPRGQEQALLGIDCPVPLCADESCQHLGELDAALSVYDMINIKLDKCGGLTEAMAMVRACEACGAALMVGNMLGSSLSMAPGFVVAQHCRFVDLDGPLWQLHDRQPALRFDGATVYAPPAELWG